MTLPKIKCPNCGELIFPTTGIRKRTNSYNDCLRCCKKCEIGISNSKNNPTVIYNKYYENVPELLRQDLDTSLNNSMNELNRKNKKNKFGFSTSEDALTWSFFKYFVVNNKFGDLLKLLNIKSEETIFDIYLWGTNICSSKTNSKFLENFIETSNSFNENSSKRTEPDVIIELQDKLIFIEVKYSRSSNEISLNEEKFKKYLTSDVNNKEIIESEHYELARNWAFVSKLSYGKNFELINLGLQKLFSDKNRNKLNQFEKALKSEKGNFRKLSWEEILEKVNNSESDLWFKDYLNNKIKPTANN